MLDHVRLSSFGTSVHSPNRLHNEDAFLLLPQRRFFAIADGMGGHNGGDIASSAALGFLQSAVEKMPNTRFRLDALTNLLIDQIQQTNSHLLDIAEKKPLLQGMGTTLLALLFDGRFVIHAHVGDSRLYRYRASALDQLTSDHTTYRENLTKKCAVITEKHMLTKVLGCEATISPSIGHQVAFPNDRYLLCSDGLSDFLSHEEIKKYITIPDLQQATEKLIQAAKTAGSQDDITAIIIQVEFPTASKL